MIKKLNKERGPLKKQPWLYYFDKDTDDLGRISYDSYSVYITLKDLHERLWLYSLRLRHALLDKNSLKKKAELRLQQKIVDEHLNQIKKLKEENERFRGNIIDKQIEKEHLKIAK